MVMTTPDKFALLGEALGGRANALEFRDSRVVYRPQARSTREILDVLGGSGGGRRLCLVAEQGLADRHPVEVADYMRMEAAANLVYAPYPVDVLCPFDIDVLPAPVVVSCRRTHPRLMNRHGAEPSDGYTEPARFITESSTSSQPPAHSAARRCDDLRELVPARRLVRQQALDAGVEPEALRSLVFAVNEVLTNGLEHGTPPRRLHVYTVRGALVCHVHDSGLGPSDPLEGYRPPDGRLPMQHLGLWLARQLCDAAEVTTDITGTHVRLFSLLP
jgi:anti-sigma regulatory factor (Ser/Thr protein kinase)